MKVVKILTIVVVTSVVTVLCIRSGQSIVKASVPAGTVYPTADDKPRTGHGVPDVRNPGGRDFVVPVGREVVDPVARDVTGPVERDVADPVERDVADPVEQDVGDHPVAGGGPDEQDVGNPGRLVANGSRSDNGTEPTATDDPADSAFAATGRSLNGGRFGAGSSAPSRAKATPTVTGRGKQTPPRTADSFKHGGGGQGGQDDLDDGRDDRGGVRDDEIDGGRDADVVLDTEPYHAANRPYYRQMDHDDYSTVDTDISAVAEEDGSTGYRQHSSYGSVMYNAGDGTNDDTADWTAAEQSGHESFGGPAVRPGYGQPAVVVPYRYPVGYQPAHYSRPRPLPPPSAGPDYFLHHHQHLHRRPVPVPVPPPLAAVQQNNVYQHQQYQQPHSALGHVQSALDKIDWHKVGVLALFKVGLAKLKAFAFLKLLFLLVFKLKLFLIAVFFKFLLLLKLMKFFKLLMVPLVLATLLPIIASLFSAPMLVGGLLSVPSRILDFLFGPVYVPSDSATVASTKNAAVAAAAAGGTAGAAGSNANTAAVTTAKAGGGGGGNGLFSVAVLSDRGPDDTAAYLMDKRRLQAMELFDPALSAFRKVLDSEKCVERIACRMAVVEKAGILPLWINWILRRVSKFIPNGKLETYLKAYDDVNNEINIKSESPGNWATWCLERYDCNTTANSTIDVDTILTDIKQ